MLTQGRQLAERAEEMSTRNLRDRRALQTASKVLMSDLENFSSKVENVKRWLQDSVNFHNLLKQVRKKSDLLTGVETGTRRTKKSFRFLFALSPTEGPDL